MKSRVVAGAFVFLAFPGLWLCREPCVLPQPGRCSSSNFTINSNEVCDVTAGSCSFTQASGLCSYSQGCADPHMSNWTLEQSDSRGYIQAKQTEAGRCPSSEFYYSVLESPWLNISHPSCLKVKYRRTTPTALDVFLEPRTGHALFLLNRSDNAPHNDIHNFKTTVDPGIGKILFRAYGGGSGSGSSVDIFRVTLELGNCTWSDVSSASYNTTDAEDLTSPLISPTQDSDERTDCLTFSYTMDQPGSWLAVSIQLLSEERRTVVWNYYSSESSETDPGRCPIQVRAPFKIIFTAYSPDSDAPVSVDHVGFSRWLKKKDCGIRPSSTSTSDTGKVVHPLEMATSADQCSTHPPSSTASTASTPSPVMTSSSPLFTLTSVQSITFTTPSLPVGLFTDGNKELSSTDGNKDDGDNSDNSSSALIPGVVAAVAVVIVFIIIIVVVVLVHRRRRLKRDQNESLTQPQDRKDGVVASKPQDNNYHDYSEIRASYFAPSAPVDDSGYFELEVVPHPPDPDFDPYEQIPGDTHGKAASPEEDDYNRLNAGGLPGKTNPRESADDDDYHHINTPGSTADPQMSSIYCLAQQEEMSADQPGLRYAYSQVNKKVKTMTVEDAPDPTNAYKKVNRKAQKPAVALKPQGKDGQSVATTRKPQGNGSANLDDMADPYNHINASTTARNHPGTSNEDQDPATDTYNRINMTSDPGHEGKSPSVADNDDYNALNFDDPTHASGAAIGPYDHVCSNPDDEYSKTGFGKRLVVIDSSYDRVKLDT